MTVNFDDYVISTENSLLDISMIHDYLSNQSYWANGRSREVVEKSIENSLCFGVFFEGKQIAFARIVTDFATFAWLCDVFVIEDYQGIGLGKWLVGKIISYPPTEKLRLWLLATSNAHELYQKYGDFEPVSNPGRWMVKWRKDQ